MLLEVSPLRGYRSKRKGSQEKCMWISTFDGPRPAILNPKRENGKTGKRESVLAAPWAYSGDAPDVHLKVTAVYTQDTLSVHLEVPIWHFNIFPRYTLNVHSTYSVL